MRTSPWLKSRELLHFPARAVRDVIVRAEAIHDRNRGDKTHLIRRFYEMQKELNVHRR